MGEHEDDLESTVDAGAEQETDRYPDTEDELRDAVSGDPDDDDGSTLDEDEAEL
jgi:hypothetical protein